jgi:hypothetical protein
MKTQLKTLLEEKNIEKLLEQNNVEEFTKTITTYATSKLQTSDLTTAIGSAEVILQLTLGVRLVSLIVPSVVTGTGEFFSY